MKVYLYAIRRDGNRVHVIYTAKPKSDIAQAVDFKDAINTNITIEDNKYTTVFIERE